MRGAVARVLVIEEDMGTMLFAELFGFASLVLFGFIYWQTAGYVSSEVDSWLARESAARALSSAADLKALLNARAATVRGGPALIALFAADGSWLAGNKASLPAPRPVWDRPFHFALDRGGGADPFLGMTHRLASGEILLVARDMRDIRQFRDRLLGAMASGGVLMLVLASPAPR
jgi:hypothetical protein